MGCSSMCRKEEVDCQPGRVTFVSQETMTVINEQTKQVKFNLLFYNLSSSFQWLNF